MVHIPSLLKVADVGPSYIGAVAHFGNGAVDALPGVIEQKHPVVGIVDLRRSPQRVGHDARILAGGGDEHRHPRMRAALPKRSYLPVVAANIKAWIERHQAVLHKAVNNRDNNYRTEDR